MDAEALRGLCACMEKGAGGKELLAGFTKESKPNQSQPLGGIVVPIHCAFDFIFALLTRGRWHSCLFLNPHSMMTPYIQHLL